MQSSGSKIKTKTNGHEDFVQIMFLTDIFGCGSLPSRRVHGKLEVFLDLKSAGTTVQDTKKLPECVLADI